MTYHDSLSFVRQRLMTTDDLQLHHPSAEVSAPLGHPGFAMKATGFSARCGFSGVVMGSGGTEFDDVM